MTKLGRIRNLIIAFLLAACAVILILIPEGGYLLVALILGISLIVSGAGQLIYFASMARHMVGGKSILYRGVFTLDLGVFTISLTTAYPIYILLYMIGVYLFSGAVDILRARESKKYGSSSWKLLMIYGIIRIAAALVSFLFIRSTNVAVLLYSASLIYSAVMRVITSFRRTAIVYVQ